jgi:hypothetical protein
MPKRRTLIASDLNAKDRAHFALVYEFCRIIKECDDADLAVPGIDNYLEKYLDLVLSAYDRTYIQRDFNRLVNGVRKGLGLRNLATIKPITLEQDYDLFVFIAWDPQSLIELSRISGWRSRSKVAVVYIIELWSSLLQQDRRYLRILDQFDHVFTLHSASVPRLPAFTRTPCSFLPTGVDCLIAAPAPSPPQRIVDVYSIGNRVMGLHRQLVDAAQRGELFYLYDSLSSSNSEVLDWHEHRLLVANTIKRSRYFMGFNPASVANSSNAWKVANEQVLPARLFEGAAGGAIILGTAPQCPEYSECFDWPDAVIEVDPDNNDILAVIRELDAQPQRIERARWTGVVRSLLQHDWVYRWEKVLSAVRIEPLPQLHERKSSLRSLAIRIDAIAGAGAIVTANQQPSFVAQKVAASRP